MNLNDKRDNKQFSQSKAQKRIECKAVEKTNTISLRYVTDMDEYSVYSFKNSNHKSFSSLLDKFRIITSLTWEQFWSRGKKHGGLEKLPIDEFDQRLINNLALSKGTTVYVTRFNGQNSRLIFRRGTKCDRVIHILGIDLNLKSYKH